MSLGSFFKSIGSDISAGVKAVQHSDVGKLVTQASDDAKAVAKGALVTVGAGNLATQIAFAGGGAGNSTDVAIEGDTEKVAGGAISVVGDLVGDTGLLKQVQSVGSLLNKVIPAGNNPVIGAVDNQNQTVDPSTGKVVGIVPMTGTVPNTNQVIAAHGGGCAVLILPLVSALIGFGGFLTCVLWTIF